MNDWKTDMERLEALARERLEGVEPMFPPIESEWYTLANGQRVRADKYKRPTQHETSKWIGQFPDAEELSWRGPNSHLPDKGLPIVARYRVCCPKHLAEWRAKGGRVEADRSFVLFVAPWTVVN